MPICSRTINEGYGDHEPAVTAATFHKPGDPAGYGTGTAAV
jgi:hypothetical protein